MAPSVLGRASTVRADGEGDSKEGSDAGSARPRRPRGLTWRPPTARAAEGIEGVQVSRRAYRRHASLCPQLLLKRCRGEVAEGLERYALARQDKEVFCFLVLGDEEDRRRA